jgi:large subunit ribosomal protein L24
MKKEWSADWNSSTKPGKQRKYIANAPLHIKSKMIVSHLSKDLKKKYGKRNSRVVKGDKIKVVRGDFRGKMGTVEIVDVKKSKVYITGIERMKKDGSKVKVALNASNLIITELNLADKKRNAKFSQPASQESKSSKQKQEAAKKQ